jgi:hypothetical protein
VSPSGEVFRISNEKRAWHQLTAPNPWIFFRTFINSVFLARKSNPRLHGARPPRNRPAYPKRASYLCRAVLGTKSVADGTHALRDPFSELTTARKRYRCSSGRSVPALYQDAAALAFRPPAASPSNRACRFGYA